MTVATEASTAAAMAIVARAAIALRKGIIEANWLASVHSQRDYRKCGSRPRRFKGA